MPFCLFCAAPDSTRKQVEDALTKLDDDLGKVHVLNRSPRLTSLLPVALTRADCFLDLPCRAEAVRVWSNRLTNA